MSTKPEVQMGTGILPRGIPGQNSSFRRPTFGISSRSTSKGHAGSHDSEVPARQDDETPTGAKTVSLGPPLASPSVNNGLIVEVEPFVRYEQPSAYSPPPLKHRDSAQSAFSFRTGESGIAQERWSEDRMTRSVETKNHSTVSLKGSLRSQGTGETVFFLDDDGKWQNTRIPNGQSYDQAALDDSPTLPPSSAISDSFNLQQCAIATPSTVLTQTSSPSSSRDLNSLVRHEEFLSGHHSDDNHVSYVSRNWSTMSEKCRGKLPAREAADIQFTSQHSGDGVVSNTEQCHPSSEYASFHVLCDRAGRTVSYHSTSSSSSGSTLNSSEVHRPPFIPGRTSSHPARPVFPTRGSSRANLKKIQPVLFTLPERGSSLAVDRSGNAASTPLNASHQPSPRYHLVVHSRETEIVGSNSRRSSLVASPTPSASSSNVVPPQSWKAGQALLPTRVSSRPRSSYSPSIASTREYLDSLFTAASESHAEAIRTRYKPSSTIHLYVPLQRHKSQPELRGHKPRVSRDEMGIPFKLKIRRSHSSYFPSSSESVHPINNGEHGFSNTLSRFFSGKKAMRNECLEPGEDSYTPVPQRDSCHRPALITLPDDFFWPEGVPRKYTSYLKQPMPVRKPDVYIPPLEPGPGTPIRFGVSYKEQRHATRAESPTLGYDNCKKAQQTSSYNNIKTANTDAGLSIRSQRQRNKRLLIKHRPMSAMSNNTVATVADVSIDPPSGEWAMDTIAEIEEAREAIREAEAWSWPSPPPRSPESTFAGISTSISASTLGPVTPPNLTDGPQAFDTIGTASTGTTHYGGVDDVTKWNTFGPSDVKGLEPSALVRGEGMTGYTGLGLRQFDDGRRGEMEYAKKTAVRRS